MTKNDQDFLVQKIRSQYTEKEHSRLDALKALDARVRRPATVFAAVFGSLGAIIMGSGMSLIMTDISSYIGMTGDVMLPGIVIGVAGMLMALVNYPIYRRILARRRKQYAGQIMTLSDTLMGQQP